MTNRDAYICMGSNKGNAALHLVEAADAVAVLPGVTLQAASSVYRTEPQDQKQQPWFHNQVLKTTCDANVTADGFLQALLDLETSMGRERDAADRFGPRVIDLDLLLFGGEVISGGERLILPHPRMEHRAFVLVPLHEVAPDLILPDGRSVNALLRQLPHRVEGDRIFQ